MNSSLFRITGLLYRIKYGNRRIFHYTTSSVVDQYFPEKKKPVFFRTKFVWVGVESGLGSVLGLWLEFVSKVVFWSFFEILRTWATTNSPISILYSSEASF